jgi:lysophospholipase L1-like esterase
MKNRFSSEVIIAPALEQQYLDAASRVMKNHQIQVNDLHALVQPELEKYAIAPDNVHFKPAGRKLLANQVAETIASEIGELVE